MLIGAFRVCIVISIIDLLMRAYLLKTCEEIAISVLYHGNTVIFLLFLFLTVLFIRACRD